MSSTFGVKTLARFPDILQKLLVVFIAEQVVQPSEQDETLLKFDILSRLHPYNTYPVILLHIRRLSMLKRSGYHQVYASSCRKTGILQV